MDQTQSVEPGKAGGQSGNQIAGKVGAVRGFLVDVRSELKKVTWPTRQELGDATKRVIIMTIAIGAIIGVLDRLLQMILVDGIAALTR